jgi:hypothetical protein
MTFDEWNSANSYNMGNAPLSVGPSSVFAKQNSNSNDIGFGETKLSDDFSLGLNKGTLQLGGALFDAWNGWQANKRAGEANDISIASFNQQADVFNDNMGMQIATLNNEVDRRNAYVGGWLDESQRMENFDADKFGQLEHYNT